MLVIGRRLRTTTQAQSWVLLWQQDLEKQRQGIVVRGNHSPFWLDYDEDQQLLDQRRERGNLRAFELAEQGLGYVRIACQLTDSFISPRGKRISAPRVRELVLCCEIVGDRRHTQRIRSRTPSAGVSVGAICQRKTKSSPITSAVSDARTSGLRAFTLSKPRNCRWGRP